MNKNSFDREAKSEHLYSIFKDWFMKFYNGKCPDRSIMKTKIINLCRNINLCFLIWCLKQKTSFDDQQNKFICQLDY